MIYDPSTVLLLPGKEFTCLLKSFMKTKKISYNELAQRMGKTKSAVHNNLKGNPKTPTREKLLQALGEKDVLQYYFNSVPSSPKNGIEIEARDLAVIQAMADVKEIMESRNEIIIAALRANIAAFKAAVRAEARLKQSEEKWKHTETNLKQEIDRLEKKVRYLEQLAGPQQESSTGKADGIGTQKKRV